MISRSPRCTISARTCRRPCSVPPRACSRSSLPVTAPLPEGGVTRIQITSTSHAPHKFAPLPVAKPFVFPPSSLRAGDRVSIMPFPYPCQWQVPQEDRFNVPFLHHVHGALMMLGPWDASSPLFSVRFFFFLAVLAGTDDPVFNCGRVWDWRPSAHVLGPDDVSCPPFAAALF